MAEPKSTKKIPKEEPEAPSPTEDEKPVVPEGFNFEELLNSPIAQSLLGGCKDIFKKEKSDPNICEITIKAPSEVVLKLFNVKE